MKKRFLVFLLGILILYTPHGFAQATREKKPTRITILHTNDMHAKIDNMAKLAYLTDSLRKLGPNVFLVAAGDNFTGNPVVDMAPEKGFPMIDLMNHCGFAVSTMGNHEFDMGQTFLRKRLEQAQFPFICANLDASGAMIGKMKPYMFLVTNMGDSIALLGLIQLDDNGMPSSSPVQLTGIRFFNGITRAREYSWLKERYGNLICLSHLGVEDDIRLADSMPQFDLIIGGHSHTLLEKPRMENGVMIVQAGSNLAYVGKTTLLLDHGHIIERHDEVIPFEALKSENKAIRLLIDQYNSNNKELDKVVAVAEQPLNGVDELGSLMTDALTNQLKVDFAFQNKGGIRVNSIGEGNITLRDIYKLDPFNNQVILFSLKPAEIKSLICYGYRHEKDIDLQVSGMSYTLTDNVKNPSVQVDLIDKSGKPLDTAQYYSVALNNYMAKTYQFDHRDPGTKTNFTTTNLLINYLSDVKKVNYKGVKRAILVK